MGKKIVLIGYMGVGKSVVGLEISKKLKINCYDVDNLIEKKFNLTVSEIFKQKGEIFFRKVEHDIFKNYIESDESFVMSTGGGTPCYFNNFQFLEREDVVSIYLKASIETIFKRVTEEKNKRPLIALMSSDDELKDFIRKHLFERSFFYNNASFKIDVDGKTINDIVKEIILLLD